MRICYFWWFFGWSDSFLFSPGLIHRAAVSWWVSRAMAAAGMVGMVGSVVFPQVSHLSSQHRPKVVNRKRGQASMNTCFESLCLCHLSYIPLVKWIHVVKSKFLAYKYKLHLLIARVTVALWRVYKRVGEMCNHFCHLPQRFLSK